ncbi:hypothetical protein PMAYCL1PPCAC_02816, partial [Pristionchus mayeri]
LTSEHHIVHTEFLATEGTSGLLSHVSRSSEMDTTDAPSAPVRTAVATTAVQVSASLADDHFRLHHVTTLAVVVRL